MGGFHSKPKKIRYGSEDNGGVQHVRESQLRLSQFDEIMPHVVPRKPGVSRVYNKIVFLKLTFVNINISFI